MALKTGDNPPTTGTALRRAASILVHQGIKIIKPITDRGGIYAYLMVHDGVAFYLVARNTPPTILGTKYMHVVSTQRFLLTIARTENRPILMAIFMTVDPNNPVWMLFHPEEILKKNLGDNHRNGIVMVNFEYDLGVSLISPKNVAPQWNKLIEKWVDQTLDVVQTKFGRAP